MNSEDNIIAKLAQKILRDISADVIAGRPVEMKNCDCPICSFRNALVNEIAQKAEAKAVGVELEILAPKGSNSEEIVKAANEKAPDYKALLEALNLSSAKDDIENISIQIKLRG